MIASRDSFLLNSLLECCSLLPRRDASPSSAITDEASCRTVVAVVGLLHVNGIASRFLFSFCLSRACAYVFPVVEASTLGLKGLG